MNELLAMQIDVLHSAPGRLRLKLHTTLTTLRGVNHIPGVTETSYNERIGTLLVKYHSDTRESDVLLRIAADAAKQSGAEFVRIVREDKKPYTLPSSGLLSLGCIIGDALLTLSGSQISKYTHWLSLLSTLGAIFEHGYSELRERGSFDPEVMSIVYLLNSVPRGGSLGASAIAWTITFGRHLIPKGKQSQDYVVRRKDGKAALTPVKPDVTGMSYAEHLLGNAAQSFVRV